MKPLPGLWELCLGWDRTKLEVTWTVKALSGAEQNETLPGLWELCLGWDRTKLEVTWTVSALSGTEQNYKLPGLWELWGHYWGFPAEPGLWSRKNQGFKWIKRSTGNEIYTRLYQTGTIYVISRDCDGVTDPLNQSITLELTPVTWVLPGRVWAG